MGAVPGRRLAGRGRAVGRGFIGMLGLRWRPASLLLGCWMVLALVACLALDRPPAFVPSASHDEEGSVRTQLAIVQAGDVLEGMLRSQARRQHEARMPQLVQVQVKPAHKESYQEWMKTQQAKLKTKSTSKHASKKHTLAQLHLDARKAKSKIMSGTWTSPMPPSFYGQLPCDEKTTKLAC